MLPFLIPDTSSGLNILVKEYKDTSLFFAEHLTNSTEVSQTIGFSAWVFDFALDVSLQIDGSAFPTGSWQITKYSPCERMITNNDSRKGDFLSIAIMEIPDTGFENGIEKKGMFSAQTVYTILKIITHVSGSENHRNDDMWIQSYIYLLLTQLGKKNKKNSQVIFGELKIIYIIMEKLNGFSMSFPTPASLVHESGIKIYRFQKGCLTLYGQSAKKIIQHLKMKSAFDSIIIRKKTISVTSSELGFRHSSNFITAFRKHFDITPTEAVFYYNPSFF